jgi:hypothetical protein
MKKRLRPYDIFNISQGMNQIHGLEPIDFWDYDIILRFFLYADLSQGLGCLQQSRTPKGCQSD